jgi:hypothetical protein
MQLEKYSMPTPLEQASRGQGGTKMWDEKDILAQ